MEIRLLIENDYRQICEINKFAFGYDDGDFYDSTLLNKNDVIRLRDSMNAHLAVLEASENKVKPELPLVFDETNLSKVE